MRLLWAAVAWLAVCAAARAHPGAGEQPLSRIAVERTVLAVDSAAHVKATPLVLGLTGENSEWVDVEFFHPNPSDDDWIGVFSPANFSAAICEPENDRQFLPELCTAPIKYQFANLKNDGYNKTGKGYLKLQLINQREDFSFALFSGGLSNPKLIAVSNKAAYVNPKAPVYPRLAQGKSWNEMTVTWTSGYDITEAVPFVEWGEKGERRFLSPAGTLTFDRNSMCGAPARTVGWRHPGYIHTSSLKELWPDSLYTYRLGHRLKNSTRIWSKSYSFKASPYPGQDSLQRVVIFGDMGKAEADGSNEFNDFQPGSLNTTYQIIRDLENIDMVVHIGDICYANGYLSQWDQFTAQIELIASTVPYMIGSGNHERDWPGTGSFYGNRDSGGECGVPAQTVFYTPAENRAKFWYATDYGMFRFCIANSEEDWRPGTEQYRFIEHCLSTVDRQKQPWLVFLAHRVLGYSSCAYYESEGTSEEPMAEAQGRHRLLWPCPQLRKNMPGLSEPMRGRRIGPLRRRVPGDDARRRRRRRGQHPGIGVRRVGAPLELLQGLRLRVRQAHGRQPLLAAVRVQEDPRRRGVRPFHHLARLPRRRRLLRRQLPPDDTGYLNLNWTTGEIV